MEATPRATYLIVSHSSRLSSLLRGVDLGSTEWSCPRATNPDDVGLFYIGQPFSSIMAVGMVESPPQLATGKVGWNNRTSASFCDFRPMWRLDATVSLEGLSIAREYVRWFEGHPYQNSKVLPPAIASLILRGVYRANPHLVEAMAEGGVPTDKSSRGRAVREVESTGLPEGAVREMTVELQYRNPWLRKLVVELRGCRCEICGFSFAESYGEIGTDFIEIHHLVPLSAKKGARQTAPIEVLLVCANCHRMLHRNGAKPLPPARLRKEVNRRRSSAS